MEPTSRKRLQGVIEQEAAVHPTPAKMTEAKTSWHRLDPVLSLLAIRHPDGANSQRYSPERRRGKVNNHRNEMAYVARAVLVVPAHREGFALNVGGRWSRLCLVDRFANTITARPAD